MAVDPLEWVVIGIVVIVIFLWGPQKIPEIARSLGRARKEFESAQKEFQQVTKEFQTQTGLAGASSGGTGILDALTGTGSETAQPPPQAGSAEQTSTTQPSQPTQATPPAKSADEVLVETARQLGISTEGKTRDQISQEILTKAKSNAPSA